MLPSSLHEFALSRVKDSPTFIPFLVYLHPPFPRLTPSQAGFWTRSLVDYHPAHLTGEVIEVLAIDPGRIVPCIPHFLPQLSAPVLESQSEECEPNPADIILDHSSGINHVPSPSTLGSGTFCNDPFSNGSQPELNFIRGPIPIHGLQRPIWPPTEDLPQDLTPQETTEDGFPGGSTAARYTGPVSSSTSPEMREGGGAFLPSHHSTLPRPESPALSYVSEAGWSGVFEPTNRDRLPSRPVINNLRAEIECLQKAFVFRVETEVYHLSVPKLFIINMAYGFLLGAASFLGLRALSYSPLGALVGSFPLSLTLLLVTGIPI